MSTPHEQIEALARQLCGSRYGEGHYGKPRTHRRYWRRKAVALIERERNIATSDAFMAIFGMRRVA